MEKFNGKQSLKNKNLMNLVKKLLGKNKKGFVKKNCKKVKSFVRKKIEK